MPMPKKPGAKSQLPLLGADQLFSCTELEAARESALKCVRCPLHETRTNVVFGDGKVDSPDIMIVGEAPGEQEDLKGKPFVGRSGELLNKMLHFIEFRREDLYVCNVVCCRPPKNRKPRVPEQVACSEYLVRQIRCVNPKVIVLMGRTAAEAVLNKKFKSIEGVRQTWYEWDGIPMRVTYHPAYLLRNPGKKPESVEDLKAIRAKVMQITERFGG